jgi:hypothetical protein
VQILSLAETRVAAEQAFAAFVSADTEVWHFALLGGGSEADDHNLRRTAQGAIADLRKLTALYLDAVRIEIGTDEDGV